MCRILLAGLMGLVLCTPGYGQTLGTISGEVKDGTGALLPGATVTVVNKATNATRTTVTNSAGLFDFPALPPGAYSVTTELEGFRTGTRDLELRVQQVLRVNFALELATLEESATVVGVSPLVETSNATVGTVIENRRIVELPLNGRNYLQLVALSPNVSADFAGPGQAGDRQGGSRANQQLSISGQRREFNNYTLDGVDNTDVNFNTYIFLPSVDALEEFKVQTGVYSAEFGRAASQVNVVTKSGTNAFNGTLFWFHRDDALDARPYAFTPSQAAAPHGAVQMGSVRVHGRRAGDEEPPLLHVEFRGLPRPEAVPDALQRAVERHAERQLLGAAEQPRACQPADRPASRHARRPDAVHRGRHDAVVRAIPGEHHSRRAARPHVDAAARVLPGTQQRHRRAREQLPRAAGSRHRQIPVHPADGLVQGSASTWMGRYSYAEDNEVTPALKLNGTKLDARVHQAMVGNTWSLSPTLLNEFRFGFNYFFNTFGRELAFERDVVSELGIPGISQNPPEAWGIPSIGITGFNGFGDNTEGPYTIDNRTFEFSDNLTWIRGRHAFKAGASFRYDMYNQVGNQFARGNFQFQNIASGYGFGDFLLGYAQQTESSVALAVTKFRALSQAYYFTDTWRLTSNQTLDLGIRYEYIPPWLDKNGTLMNAHIPFHDTTPNVQDLSRHPVLVRIGER